MRKVIFGLLVIFGLSACAGSHTTTSTQQLGEACDEERLCIEGLVCENGTCRKLCENDKQCGEKEVCKDKICVYTGKCHGHLIGSNCDQCETGYFGKSCEACPKCGDHGRCNDGKDNDGKCICDKGWKGQNCEIGIKCKEGWAGDNCDACSDGYFGENCQKCPDCDHGHCDATRTGSGQCICDTGWTDAVCSSCKKDYFGENCEKCPECGHGQCRDTLEGTGECACNEGWAAPDCITCEIGYYSTNCAMCTRPEGQYDKANNEDCQLKIGDDTYQVVYIDGQIWMGENMRSPGEQLGVDYFYPANNQASVVTLGYLYSWEKAKKICPKGWHLPTQLELEKLLGYAGEKATDNEFLTLISKSADWSDYSYQGQNELGFGALPAGTSTMVDKTTTEYNGYGINGGWWSSSLDSDQKANYLLLGGGNALVNSGSMESGYSVRCLMGDDCEDGYYGQNCTACGDCGHGHCNDKLGGDGSCICDEGWTGAKCDQCAEGYYGQNCAMCTRPGGEYDKASKEDCQLTIGSNTYQVVYINGRIWLGENIHETKAEMQYGKDYYYAGDVEENTEKYGYLYTWQVAKDICPAGWHLATKDEYQSLLINYSSPNEALRHIDFGGDDASGFGALPAGDENFEIGHEAYFWTSTIDNTDKKKAGFFTVEWGNVSYSTYPIATGFHAVRCVLGDDCEKNHYGPECQACNADGCGHGRCNDRLGGEGSCICDKGWIGDRCNMCDEGYYGDNCAMCTRPGGTYNQADPNDCQLHYENQTYQVVYINGQIWMGDNMRSRSGTLNTDYYYPQGDSNNVATLGYLYSWQKAKTICPYGWHLPTKDEYQSLWDYAGKNSDKIRDSSFENGINTTGFGALPAGDSRNSKGSYLWADTKDEDDSDAAYYFNVKTGMSREAMDVGQSVRCLLGTDCEPNHYGTHCNECQSCGHGHCNDGLGGDGSCFCDEGWTGAKCDTCASGYYGANCTKCNCSNSQYPVCNDGKTGDGSCKCRELQTGTMTDKSGSKLYKTVCLDGKYWMSQNMNYITGTYGTNYFYPDGDSSNANMYGLLYDWKTARNICPSNWHLPTRAEYNGLLSQVGNSAETRAKALRDTRFAGGTNSSKFAALPAGDSTGYFGSWATFWNSSSLSITAGVFDIGSSDVRNSYNYEKTKGLAVRCVEGAECVENFYGPGCISCPSCVHGHCNDGKAGTGTCVCDPGWSGSKCDVCDDGWTGTMKDSRNNKTYNTVCIGRKLWMAENLNYESITNSYPNGNASNATSYGRLYEWRVARKACPSGWHMPKYTDYNVLLAALSGSTSDKSNALRASSFASGSNSSKFNALAAGYGRKSNYYDFGKEAAFWTSSTYLSDNRLAVHYFGVTNEEVKNTQGKWANDSLAIRCLEGAECPANKYGSTCSSTCNVNCKGNGICNDGLNGDGTCLCNEGWRGTNCNYCKDGTTGTMVTGSKSYKTVCINGRFWMAENMSYATGTYSYPKGLSSNQATYGLLYNYNTATTICPSGWHLPTKTEYEELLDFLGTASLSEKAKALRATTFANGSDAYGFKALPAGHYFNNSYYYFGSEAKFWAKGTGSSTPYLNISSASVQMGEFDSAVRTAVRCIKDL